MLTPQIAVFYAALLPTLVPASPVRGLARLAMSALP
jgi:hypothetical protein